MSTIPMLTRKEEDEFSYQLTKVGRSLMNYSEDEFRSMCPELKSRPSLQFRVKEKGMWAVVFVREEDWNEIVNRELKKLEAANKNLWVLVTEGVVINLVLGLFFMLCVRLANIYFSTQVNQWIGWWVGLGLGMAILLFRLASRL